MAYNITKSVLPLNFILEFVYRIELRIVIMNCLINWHIICDIYKGRLKTLRIERCLCKIRNNIQSSSHYSFPLKKNLIAVQKDGAKSYEKKTVLNELNTDSIGD